ncbi:MAG: hypothetical protein QOE37_836 [Microbacteriaceae bacterium]|nr:hypothetical protein [Microbacteriaceae bacterium]
MRWFRSNVDSTLTEFFTARRRGCAGQRLERVGRVELALRDCVEATAARVLTDEEQWLLAAEQQFRPDGAAGRVAEPEALLFVLPIFLTEPQWCPADVEERRAQLLASAALTRHLVTTLNGAEVDCAVHAIGAALDAAAAQIRAAERKPPAVPSRSTGTTR